MPLLCPNGFDTCTTTLEARERFRKNNTDVGTSEVHPTLQRTDMAVIGRFSWVLLPNDGQRNTNGSYINASCRSREIHLPEKFKALLRARPLK